MIWLYIKKNMLKFLGLTLFLFFIMNLWQTRNESLRFELYNDAKNYIERHIENLRWDIAADEERFSQKAASIEFLEGKSEMDEEDKIALLMGQYKMTQSDIVWINNHLNAAGEETNSVMSDRELLRILNKDFKPQFSLSAETENRILLEERNLKRYSPSDYEYKLAELSLKNLSEIDISYGGNRSVYGFSLYFPMLRSDYMFILLIAVISFSVFSSLRENGYLMWISTLKSSINGFAIKFHIAGLMLVILSFLVYFGLFTARILAYLPDTDVLNAPAQVLVGCEGLLFPVTVGEYLALWGLVKCLFAMGIYSAVSLISLVSKNSIIAFVLSALLCGGVIGAGVMGVGFVGALFSGDLSRINDYPYMNFFGEPVSTFGVIVSLLLVFIVLAAITVRLAAKKLSCGGRA